MQLPTVRYRRLKCTPAVGYVCWQYSDRHIMVALCLFPGHSLNVHWERMHACSVDPRRMVARQKPPPSVFSHQLKVNIQPRSGCYRSSHHLSLPFRVIIPIHQINSLFAPFVLPWAIFLPILLTCPPLLQPIATLMDETMRCCSAPRGLTYVGNTPVIHTVETYAALLSSAVLSHLGRPALALN